ncbi:VapD family protein [Thomasclavelia sp.]|uniref:VapD family protein n=1 Tax=Thomasclavelia sp. TaxID=3025757 RepID=UPI0025F93D34|nr:VapD family protein [Thomasclavelia sp.]
MKNFSKTRKAINFDLDEKLLKKHYPSKNYRNSWKDIGKYLGSNGFLHRQYSGYVSKDYISMSDVGNIVINMAEYYSWLGLCVQQFDVTIVGNEYSFVSRIKNC